MKKFLSPVLALLSLCQLLLMPAQAVGAETADISDAIRAQYRAYAESQYVPEADDKVVDQYWAHAMNGGDLYVGEGSAMVSAVLHSELFEEAFVDSLTVAFNSRENLKQEELTLRSGMLCWYDHKRGYRFSRVEDDGNSDDEDDVWLAALQSETTYITDCNENDDVLALVGGTVKCRIELERTEMTPDEISYDMSVRVYDRFEFEGDYSADRENGLDTSKAELLTVLGKLMGLNEFYWQTEFDFCLTIPNPCIHANTNYCWEFDGSGELVSVLSADTVENPLVRKKGTTENGLFYQTSYVPDRPIRLEHDKPWSFEIRCRDNGFFYLVTTENITADGAYFRKAANTAFFGQAVYLEPDDEKHTTTHYGVWYTGKREYPVDVMQAHTYRLTNRVAEDGSNMVYLSVDGVDFGPMNQYYHAGTSQNARVDWVSGRDFEFSYVGSGTYMIDDIAIEYIRVWENGVDGPAQRSAFTATDAGANHTDYTCALCGCSDRVYHTEGEAGRVTVRQEGERITLSLADAPEELCVMAAAYNADGTLRQVKSLSAEGEQLQFALSGESVRLFFLHRDTLAPLLPDITI